MGAIVIVFGDAAYSAGIVAAKQATGDYFGDFTDEGVKDAEAIESLEAEFARHLHAARAVRNKKARSGNQPRKRKRVLREPALRCVAEEARLEGAAPVIAAPKEGGGWKVLALDGFGWIKWNRDSGKMDAHCARHRGCKANRRAKVGPLGMQALWLQSCCGDGSQRSSHILGKAETSSPDFFEARARAQSWLHTLAETNPNIVDLLQGEVASRDGFCFS